MFLDLAAWNICSFYCVSEPIQAYTLAQEQMYDMALKCAIWALSTSKLCHLLWDPQSLLDISPTLQQNGGKKSFTERKSVSFHMVHSSQSL